MAVFVDAYRDVLYHLRYPTALQLIVLGVGSLATLAVGIGVFRRFEPRLAEVL
jgi:ABC-type polysaccharide/polyol phosphate export permease